MGFLTTIQIKNDRLGEFQNDPEAFGKSILEAINRANYSRLPEQGAITVHPSRHADEFVIYISNGNTLIELGPYSKQTERVMRFNLDWIDNISLWAGQEIRKLRSLVKQEWDNRKLDTRLNSKKKK